MRLSRFFGALVVALTTMLAVASGGSAITNGQPDGNAHPYVGLMVALDEDGVPLWRCSGSCFPRRCFSPPVIAPSRRLPMLRFGSVRDRS